MAWPKRPTSWRATADADLTRRIRTVHAGSRGTYDAPRAHAELKAEGVVIGRKRIALLMRAAAVIGVSRRRRVTTTRRDPAHPPANDLVRRNFTASGPNGLWVADITFIPTAAGFLFLAVMLDAWSRRIVVWAFSADLKTRVVLDALDMALASRTPDNVIHHSDPGSQYTSLAFGARCRGAGVRPSTGSVGDAYDNAMSESFFAIPKVRTARPPPLRIPYRSPHGRIPLHRGLLQSDPPAFDVGIPLADRVRKEKP